MCPKSKMLSSKAGLASFPGPTHLGTRLRLDADMQMGLFVCLCVSQLSTFLAVTANQQGVVFPLRAALHSKVPGTVHNTCSTEALYVFRNGTSDMRTCYDRVRG